jgi:hypothetical protein
VRPEDALDAARAADAAAPPGPALDGVRVEPSDGVDLAAWAAIEADPRTLRSTRRLGAPLTWLKRALWRAQRQQQAELLAQQTRFNLQVAARVAELEARLRALEGRGDRPPGP